MRPNVRSPSYKVLITDSIRSELFNYSLIGQLNFHYLKNLIFMSDAK